MEKLSIDDDLYLENVRIAYAELIFKSIDADREHLRRWLPFVDHTRVVRDTELFIRSIVDKPRGERDDVYMIWYKHEFAGLIGFKDTDRINSKVEIGYWLLKRMTGKGIATRATGKMINLAFRNLKMNRIQIRCGVGNTRSSAIPRRLGFTLEGIERAGERHSDRFIDLEIYSLLRNEWVDKLLDR